MLVRKNAVKRCLARVRHWKVPPNWSRHQWLEEAAAQAELAATIERPTVGEPSASRLRANAIASRILNSVLKSYRQEWSFARHCGRCIVCEPAEPDDPDDGVAPMLPCLPCALAQLSEPDRRLIQMLYWEHRTEAQIAADFGISQQAISKRKRRIFLQLSSTLKTEYGPAHV